MRKKVIYAELDGIVRRLTTELLNYRGFDVVATAHSRDLLEKLDERFDVVVVAYELPPDLDGLEVLKRIRGSSRLYSMPVVVHAMDEEARPDVEQYGGVFAKKDGHVETLVNAINEALARKKG